MKSFEISRTDRPIARAAMQALSRRKGAEVTTALLRLLHDHDNNVRQAVIQLLADREGAEVTAALLNVLEDQDENIREAAFRVLMKRRGVNITEIIFKALRDSDREVRRLAVQTLSSDAPPECREALNTQLADMLSSPNVSIRLGAIDAVQSLIESCGQNVKEGPSLANLLIRNLSDFNPAVRDAATRVLEDTPAAWLSLRLLPHLPDPIEPLPLGLIQILTCCGEPSTTSWIAATMFQGEPKECEKAAKAIGILGDNYGLPALLAAFRENHVDAALLEASTEALKLMGPVVWQQLRPLLFGRDVPEALLTAAVVALGASGDPSTVSQLLELLSHPSLMVRTAAATALRCYGDPIAPVLTAPLATRTLEARVYNELLLSLMEGQPLPQSADLAGQWSGEPLTAEEMKLTPDEHEVPFQKHILELIQRIGIASIAALIAGLVGAMFSNRLMPLLALIIYDVPTSVLSFNLPPEPFLSQTFGLFFAAWVGLPMYLYQLWKFVSRGLTLRERRLTLPMVVCLMVAVLMTPLIATMVARLVGFGADISNLIPDDQATTIWLTDRITVVILILIFWIVGFRTAWNWFSLQARARYVLRLTTAQPLLSPKAFSDITRRGMRWIALTSLFVLPFLPVYLTTSLLLGFFVILIIAGLFIFSLVRVGIAERPSMGHFLLGLFEGLIGFKILFWWPMAAIALIVFHAPVAKGLCQLLYGKATLLSYGPCIGSYSLMVPWFIFTHAAWAAMAIGSAVSLVFFLIRRRLDAHVGEVLGRLFSFLIIVSPLILISLYWRLMSTIQLGWSPATLAWLCTHLALATSLLVLDIILLWASRGLLKKMNLSLIAQVLFPSFLLSLVPTTVLTAAVALPSLLFIVALPVGLDILVTQGLKGAIESLRFGLNKFKSAVQDVKEEVSSR